MMLPVRIKPRCWAMLIKRVYQADPLLCPNCGGTMKIVAFIEARQDEILRKILELCGLWQQSLSRDPPGSTRSAHAGRQACNPDSRLNFEADPDFFDHPRREELEQPQLPESPEATHHPGQLGT